MYEPNISPKLNMSKEEYRNLNSTTINHFYEKLFKLKDLMNTETAIEITKKNRIVYEKFCNRILE